MTSDFLRLYVRQGELQDESGLCGGKTGRFRAVPDLAAAGGPRMSGSFHSNFGFRLVGRQTVSYRFVDTRTVTAGTGECQRPRHAKINEVSAKRSGSGSRNVPGCDRPRWRSGRCCLPRRLEAVSMAKSKIKRKRTPKSILKLPDLEQSKSAVLNILTSPSSQRTYDHGIREFIEGHSLERGLSFNVL